MDASWNVWSETFLDNFNEHGWHELYFAYTFKYVKGILLDYNLKKIKSFVKC